MLAGAGSTDATSAATGHGGSVTPAQSTSATMPECAKDPTVASCRTFVYPDESAKMDIQTNCQAMPFMVGCSIWNACESGEMGPDNKLCQPFQVLATTCNDQGMSGMAGCHVYTPMCSTGSVVAQCTGAGLQRMVHTMQTQVRSPRCSSGAADVSSVC
jgi:hypothetical protein